MTDTDPTQPTASLCAARTVVRHQLHSLWSTAEPSTTIPPIMLWGPPGVGKSSIVADVCATENIEFIDIRLAQRDPVDIRGLPVPREDAVHWLLAADWPRDPDSRGIILFDELTAADRSLQVAVYELILDRRLGSLYDLPPGWLICAAGNRGEDGAVATAFSSALANRFCHLELAPTLTEWLVWAQQQAIHPDVIAFLRFRPDCLLSLTGDVERGWPSPRSWARVSGVLGAHDRGELERSALELMIHGLVGPAAGGELIAFLDRQEAIPDVAAMLQGEAEITIPEPADLRYALCAAAVHELWHGAAAGTEPTIRGFFRLTEALSSDYATLALSDALTGPDEATTQRRAQTLLEHPAFERWAEQHGSAFARAREVA